MNEINIAHRHNKVWHTDGLSGYPGLTDLQEHSSNMCVQVSHFSPRACLPEGAGEGCIPELGGSRQAGPHVSPSQLEKRSLVVHKGPYKYSLKRGNNYFRQF